MDAMDDAMDRSDDELDDEMGGSDGSDDEADDSSEDEGEASSRAQRSAKAGCKERAYTAEDMRSALRMMLAAELMSGKRPGAESLARQLGCPTMGTSFFLLPRIPSRESLAAPRCSLSWSVAIGRQAEPNLSRSYLLAELPRAAG